MFIRVWAAGYLIKRKQLTTWGPYSYTRNPLYLGTFVIGIGLCIVQRSILFLIIYAALFIFVYYFQIQHEEETLEEKFGEDFREYCRNVPRFFPRLTPYRTSGLDKSRRFSLSYMWKNKGGETIGQVIGVFLVLDIKEYIILPFLFNKENLGQLIVHYFKHFI
jgi:disulfide bond formation protein DsbB